MKKENKFLSIFLSIMIVFSLFTPSKITAEGDETDPKEENPTQQVEVGEEEKGSGEETSEKAPAEGASEQPGDNEENPNEVPAETPGEEESPSDVEEEDNKETTYSFGYVSGGFVDVDGLVVQRDNRLRKSSASNEESLPQFYEVDHTGIKDQGHYGTCWSFAMIASAESSYLKKTGKTLDLSELHLAFYGYHNKGAEDKLGLITEDSFYVPNEDEEGELFQTGGDDYVAAFLLADGIGFVSEENLPYAALDQNNYSLARFLQYLESRYANYQDNCFKNTEYYATDINFISGSDISSIKEALINYGAVTMSFYATGPNESDEFWNAETYAYYC